MAEPFARRKTAALAELRNIRTSSPERSTCIRASQTVDLVRRLRELKVPHEVIVYPDEVHDFLLHKNRVEIYKASFDFFERHLKSAKPKAVQGN